MFGAIRDLARALGGAMGEILELLGSLDESYDDMDVMPLPPPARSPDPSRSPNPRRDQRRRFDLKVRQVIARNGGYAGYRTATAHKARDTIWN